MDQHQIEFSSRFRRFRLSVLPRDEYESAICVTIVLGHALVVVESLSALSGTRRWASAEEVDDE